MRFFIYRVYNNYDNSFSVSCCMENGKIVVIKKGFTNYYHYQDNEFGQKIMIDPFDGPIKVSRKVSIGTPTTEYHGSNIYDVHDDRIKFLNLYNYEFNRWYDNIDGDFIPLGYLTKNEMKKYTIAFDIEADFDKDGTSLQDMITLPSKYKITVISFIIENKKIAYVNENYFEDNKDKIDDYCNENQEIKIMSESDLLEETFELLTQYPFISGYNSSSFDLMCIYYRGIELGLSYIDLCDYNDKYNNVKFLDSVSVDMYLYFKNEAIKNYIYWSGYKRLGLNPVSEFILGRGKLEVDFDVYDFQYIIYCFEDSQLVWDLLFAEACDMILIFSKILRIAIDTFIHTKISYWAQILVKNYMYKNNYLVPTKDYIRLKGQSVPRRYTGGMNPDPVSGVHKDVDVYDFTSLYPTILNYYNISFETVNCGHDECKDNYVPGCGHYTCRLKTGIFPQIFGVLFNDRVKIKSLGSKDKKSTETKYIDTYYIKGTYNTYLIHLIQFAYKILMNGGGYGMLGYQYFHFFNVNAAESITMNGRFWIKTLEKKMALYDAPVIYGDTDSIFIKTKRSQDDILNYIKTFCPLKMEWEKRYKFLILTNRKKNYLGVKGNKDIDFKGLTLKKTNSPEFFSKILSNIKRINFDSIDNITVFKRSIFSIFKKYYIKLGKQMLTKEDLKIKTRLSRKIDQYKSRTEIVQIFEQFKEDNFNSLLAGKEKVDNPLKDLKSGDFVEYYRSILGPKLLNAHTRPDWDKYKTLLISACSQFFPNAKNELKGIKKLTDFFN